MKTFLQLSPLAQNVVLQMKYEKAGAGHEVSVTSILLAASRRHLRIREVLGAIGECVEAGWMEAHSGSPDRVCLTSEGFTMLALMP